MKLLQLHLKAYGPFTDRVVELSPGGQGLVLVHGPNEAGKSSMLRAISDLRFGIPHLSADDFVHRHADMRVGGVFLDAHGGRHALMRRKGRSGTLSGFAAGSDGAPVAPEVERLLTAGLSKADHDAMYALDHQRLRSGGRALLEGEGELGAALFEASAGVRSVPALLERLDQAARQYFVPRGKLGRINEALRGYDEHHKALRAATVTPNAWGELPRRHEEAAAALMRVEARRRAQLDELLRVKELRAVAPLLGAIRQAGETLAELAAAPLLAADCAAGRVAAETALADARLGERQAADDSQRQHDRLARLQAEPRVLEAAAAIERLGAAAESVATLRADCARAGAETAAAQAEIDALAAQIDPAAADAAAVLARVPSATARAAVDEALRGVEQAAQALDHHLASPPPPQADGDDDAAAGAATPPAEARAALRGAVREATRLDGTLARLEALPRERAGAARQLAAALAALGVADAAALHGMRPLLDAEIDAALRQCDTRAAQSGDLHRRLAEMADARASRLAEHDALLAAGAVPTRDEVLAARARRDAAWQRLRDGAAPPADAAAYEHEVRAADRLADELARDSARAAQLQACLHGLAQLDRDSALRERELAALAADEHEADCAWAQRLRGAGLPVAAPQALREWQARLGLARQGAEALDRAADEERHAAALAADAAVALRAALLATGLAAPGADAGLRALLALAAEVEDELRQRDKRRDTAAGQRGERGERRAQWLAREAELRRRLDAAQAAARPLLGALRLADSATAAVARARLAEFDRLRDARAALDAATLRLAHSRAGLDRLHAQAATLAARLGDALPDDVRLYADRLAERLAEARRADAARALAVQARDSADAAARRHQAAADAQQARLAALCAAAGVATPLELPQAEERSQRRREAQAGLDRSLAQLARASRRPHDELHELLEQRDAAGLDADEEACESAVAAAEAELRGARDAEESARRELEAIDASDTAAAARARMEQAAAAVRAHVGPWMRSRLAHALLAEATRRFRERAQGPMLEAATAYFQRMTGGEFVRLLGDDAEQRPVLLAQRRDGTRLKVEALSEGTCDQLYLALRLAAVQIRRAAGVDLPVVLDDVLMTSDDRRAALMLQALGDFSQGGQVIVFTHHDHLAELARRSMGAQALWTAAL